MLQKKSTVEQFEIMIYTDQKQKYPSNINYDFWFADSFSLNLPPDLYLLEYFSFFITILSFLFPDDLDLIFFTGFSLFNLELRNLEFLQCIIKKPGCIFEAFSKINRMLLGLVFGNLIEMISKPNQAVCETFYCIGLIYLGLFFCILPYFLGFFDILCQLDSSFVNDFAFFSQLSLSQFHLNENRDTYFLMVSFSCQANLMLFLIYCILEVSSEAFKTLSV